jgi:hypothetical protein
MPRITSSLLVDPRQPRWDEPQPGELLFDARDFLRKAEDSIKPAVRARYARASLLMSVAAVEAISNDTLLCIYDLLAEICPSECVGLLPWRAFSRTSYRPIERMLHRNSSLSKKLKYIFGHLRRLSTGYADLDALERKLKRSIQARNRVVHMTFLLRPGHRGEVLNPRRVIHLARTALDAATDYITEVGSTFEDIKLPISTTSFSSYMSQGPDWWPADEWG